MSNAATIKGDNTVLWGTASGTTLAGIIVRVRNMLTGEMVEIADEVGFTVAVVYFNDKNECEVEMIVKTSYPTIARGDTVTIMGATCLAGDYEKVWEQKGVRKYTLKATRWAGFTPA
jgi:predicted transcriptional regulator